jgi:hypothetical protein
MKNITSLLINLSDLDSGTHANIENFPITANAIRRQG